MASTLNFYFILVNFLCSLYQDARSKVMGQLQHTINVCMQCDQWYWLLSVASIADAVYIHHVMI